MKSGHIKIFIVEDEGVVALDLKSNLERLGYYVCGIAPSGEETLEKIPVANPDLVIMDIKLQGEMDGIDTADFLKKEYDIPVIILSAYSDAGIIERAKSIEPFGYIIKPFSINDLRITIEMAIYRIEMKHKLNISRARYKRFFYADLSGAFVCKPDGGLIDYNPVFRKILELDQENETAGINLNDFFIEENEKEGFWSQMSDKLDNEPVETRFRTLKGNIISLMVNIVGICDRTGNLIEYNGYIMDISHIRKLEHQLRQSKKMEAIGNLAGGIAHDFNNLLTIILGYSTLIDDKISMGEGIAGEVEGIRNAALKANSLTKHLLAFSRKQVLKPEVVEMNSLIENISKMINRLMPENISLGIFTEAKNDTVFIDQSQMEQVILNLVLNARDAMAEGGNLIVRTSNVQLEKSVVSSTGRIPSGNYLTISVSDNGSGISRENLELIFDPFFTTKPVDKGTGLGLASAYGIINQSGGFIDVTTEIGKGSVFTVYLKNTSSEKRQKADQEFNPESLSGNETILLVEDTDEVRKLIVRILTSKGYDVIEASNPGEAILIAENRKRRFRLLLTDVYMPHMNGKQLAERLKAMGMDFDTIFISGHPSKSIQKKGINPERDNFLQKPFEPIDLLTRVRTVLDR